MKLSSTPASDAPEGATPLDPDEAEGLLPDHIATVEQLNAWEQLNIAQAWTWAMSGRRRSVPEVLSVRYAEALHRRMFDHTWSWAGRYRSTAKNIGLPQQQVRVALRERITDTALWIEQSVYDADESAARLHHQLVLVHPWPNGNGRWARLMSDSLLHAQRRVPFTWGGAALQEPGQARRAYLAALRAADRGEFGPLLGFVRS